MRLIYAQKWRTIRRAAVASWIAAVALTTLHCTKHWPSHEVATLVLWLILGLAITTSIASLVKCALAPMETAYLLGFERGFKDGSQIDRPRLNVVPLKSAEFRTNRAEGETHAEAQTRG